MPANLEVLVLQICLIQKPTLISLLLVLFRCRVFRSPRPVSNPQQTPETTKTRNLHADAENHHRDAQGVPRRLLRLEEEGADKVTEAVSDQKHRVRCNLLGVTRSVGRGDRHGQRPGRCVGEGNPEAGEATVGVGLVDEPEAEDTGEEGGETGQHDGYASVWVVGSEEAALR